MQIGEGQRCASVGRMKRLNFSWLIRSWKRILVNVRTNLTGEGRVVSHIGTSTPYGVFAAYAVTGVWKPRPLWKFRLVPFAIYESVDLLQSDKFVKCVSTNRESVVTFLIARPFNIV